MRLDKFLAELNVGTRSQVKDLIRKKLVTVNGAPVTKPEHSIDPETDQVCLQGKPLIYSQFQYFLLNKPGGVVSATRDKLSETVLSLLPNDHKKDLFPVGRLDKDTSGLLLLTNDGDFAHRVISPKSAVEKCYSARVDGEVDEEDVKAFREGLTLRDGTCCLPAILEPLEHGACRVRVKEGKYHQVRRMLASRGKPVLELRRLSVGALLLDEQLGPGGWKELDQEALCRVFSPDPMGKTSKKPSNF